MCTTGTHEKDNSYIHSANLSIYPYKTPSVRNSIPNTITTHDVEVRFDGDVKIK